MKVQPIKTALALTLGLFLVSMGLLAAQKDKHAPAAAKKPAKAAMKNGPDDITINNCQPDKIHSHADPEKDIGTVSFKAQDQDYWIWFSDPTVFQSGVTNPTHVQKGGQGTTLYVVIDPDPTKPVKTQYWFGNCSPFLLMGKKKIITSDPNDITVP